MSGSVNKVILIGNLGRDPEVRFNPEGGRIVSISLATSEVWKEKASGERRDRTEWHSVVVFNEKIGEICEKYLRKGSRVYLEGQLQTRKWTDKQGVERYKTDIVIAKYRGELSLLGSSDSNTSEDVGSSREPTINNKPSQAFNSREFLNDDVPF